MVSAKTENREIHAIGASPGIAIGPVRITDRSRVAVVETGITPDNVGAEIRRFRDALASVESELQTIKKEVEAEQGPEHLHVIDAHLLILQDSMLSHETIRTIERELINAEAALKKALVKFKKLFEGISDEYLRERSADVETVVERVLRCMVGKRQQSINDVAGLSIIVAHDLSPADVLQIDKAKVIGFVTDLGGKTSHSAILARALEIPAVVGLERITAQVADGDVLIIDGTTGVLIINPDQQTFRDYLRRKQRYEYMEQESLKLKDLPAETTDGHRILLKGNVEFIEEISSLKGHGGEGIGLYRTEMLFFNRPQLPDEEEQVAAYAAVVRAMAPLLSLSGRWMWEATSLLPTLIWSTSSIRTGTEGHTVVATSAGNFPASIEGYSQGKRRGQGTNLLPHDIGGRRDPCGKSVAPEGEAGTAR